MRLKILLTILGLLIVGSTSYLVANTYFKPKPPKETKLVGFENLKDEATKSAETKKEEVKAQSGEVSGATTPYATQQTEKQESQPESNNQSRSQSQQSDNSQSDISQYNFDFLFEPQPQNNSPTQEDCDSEKAYLDSQYQSDVATENRNYQISRDALLEDLARRNMLFSGIGQRELGVLEVEHKNRLGNLKTTYERNLNNLVREGCTF